MHRPGPLQGFSVLDEDAVFRPFAHPHHQRGRRRQAEGTGAGDDKDGDEAGQGQGRRMADREPERVSQDRNHQHGGDEEGRNAVGQLLDRGARALRLPDQGGDAGQSRLRPDAGDLEDKGAARVHGRADDYAADGFLHRQALAGNHTLVNGRRALDDAPIYGNALTGPDAHMIPYPHLFDGDVLLQTALDDTSGLGLQAEQGLDGRTGPALRPCFEHPSQQQQGDDDVGGLIIDVWRSEEARQGGRRQGVGVGGAGPQRDQSIHVAAALLQGQPGPPEERVACPEQHRGGEKKLRPRRDKPSGEGQAHHLAAHRADDHRQGEQGRCPEAPRKGASGLGVVGLRRVGRQGRGLIADLLDGGGDDQRRGQSGVVGEHAPVCQQVDGGIGDARHAAFSTRETQAAQVMPVMARSARASPFWGLEATGPASFGPKKNQYSRPITPPPPISTASSAPFMGTTYSSSGGKPMSVSASATWARPVRASS